MSTHGAVIVVVVVALVRRQPDAFQMVPQLAAVTLNPVDLGSYTPATKHFSVCKINAVA